jgi:hypothetical protein
MYSKFRIRRLSDCKLLEPCRISEEKYDPHLLYEIKSTLRQMVNEAYIY